VNLIQLEASAVLPSQNNLGSLHGEFDIPYSEFLEELAVA
jgi:hypothetical protein